MLLKTKKHFMIFHPRQKKISVNVPLVVKNTIIKQVVETKFLDIYLLQKRIVCLLSKAHYPPHYLPNLKSLTYIALILSLLLHLCIPVTIIFCLIAFVTSFK